MKKLLNKFMPSSLQEQPAKPVSKQQLDQNAPAFFSLAEVGKRRLAKLQIEDPRTEDSKQQDSILKKRRSTNPWDTLTSRYETIEPIGEGGTSIVYRALDQSIGREVALKRFHPGMGPDTKDSTYEKEAKLISRLDHPNIVTTHDMGHDSIGHFIIMSLIDGADLNKYLSKSSLNTPQLKSLFLQCIDGLHAIHNANIIHLDLKPSNVMIQDIRETRLHAQIIDFGSARSLSGYHEGKSMVINQGLHGTIHYMSPEQINQEPLDFRSDIYSLGCMFYELLTGERPFTGDNSVQIMAAHIQNRFTPLDEIRQDLPADLCSLIHSMIAKKREDRPQDTNALAELYDATSW